MGESKQCTWTVLLSGREQLLNAHLTSWARILEAEFHNGKVPQIFESTALSVRQTLLL